MSALTSMEGRSGGSTSSIMPPSKSKKYLKSSNSYEGHHETFLGHLILLMQLPWLIPLVSRAWLYIAFDAWQVIWRGKCIWLKMFNKVSNIRQLLGQLSSQRRGRQGKRKYNTSIIKVHIHSKIRVTDHLNIYNKIKIHDRLQVNYRYPFDPWPR